MRQSYGSSWSLTKSLSAKCVKNTMPKKNHFGKVFFNSSTEKTKQLKESTEQVDLSGGKHDHEGHAGNLSKASSDYQDAKCHHRKALKNKFDGCTDRFEKQRRRLCRECMLEIGHTRKTMNSWDQVATGPQQDHPMSPQRGPTRYQRVSILILDKLTAHAWIPFVAVGDR